MRIGVLQEREEALLEDIIDFRGLDFGNGEGVARGRESLWRVVFGWKRVEAKEGRKTGAARSDVVCMARSSRAEVGRVQG